MALNTKTISAGVGDILNIDGGVDASSPRQVLDGDGTGLPLYLTTTRLGIGESSPDGKLHITNTGVDDALPAVKIENTNTGSATAPDILILRNSSSPAGDDFLGTLTFAGRNSAPEDIDYADIFAQIVDTTDGSEDGRLILRTVVAGSPNNTVNITGGKVGIGSATPDYLLDVESTTSTGRINSTGDNNAGLILQNTSCEWFNYIAPTTGNWKLKDTTSDVTPITIEKNSDDNMLYLKANGKIGIGETSPDDKLHIKESTSNQYVMKVEHTHASEANGINISYSGGNGFGSGDDYPIYFQDTDGAHFTVSGDGSATITGSGTAVSSDRRIKTDIVDATSKLNDINSLKVRNFDYIHKDGTKSGKKHIGFIADEFATVFPSMVTTVKQKAFGEDYTDLQRIMDSALVPILVKAIQELSAKVTALESA